MARVVVALLLCLGALGLAGPEAGASPFSASELTIEPGPGVTLSVAGRPYAGELTVASDGGGVDVVNRIGFEQYVEGIAEMPSNWPAASLEAQAVAARTYALWTVLTHQPGPGGGQICATDACQVYAGLSKPEGPDGSRWVAAVEATRGEVLQYQGRIIEALYGSSDGGRTLYGGVPWLPSVSDPEDRLAPEHQWSWSVPLARMAAVLAVPAGQTLTSLVSSSSAITETLRDSAGHQSAVAMTPNQFHSQVNAGMPAPGGLDLPLPSYRYSVSTYGTSVSVSGVGDGNALGLSQYGALGKAEEGWTAGQILADYYEGTTLSALPQGEMPSVISVTLASGAAGSTMATIAANGPVRIVDGRGRVVASTAGPAAWTAAPAQGGVGLTPASGVATTPAPDLSSDTAPIPQRVAPAVSRPAAPSAGTGASGTAASGTAASGTAANGTAPGGPATTAPPASALSGAPGGAAAGALAAAGPLDGRLGGPLGGPAPSGSSSLVPAGAGAAGLLVVAGSAWAWIVRRQRRSKGLDCSAAG